MRRSRTKGRWVLPGAAVIVGLVLAALSCWSFFYPDAVLDLLQAFDFTGS